jgi:hypothetical protein
MKKLMLLSPIIFIAVSSNAQTEKGNLMVGANIGGINFNTVGTTSAFSANINPQVGKFIFNGLAVGAGIDFSIQKAKNVDAITSYGLVPFVRYYFKKEGELNTSNERFFATAKIGFGGIKANGVSSSSLIYGVGVGYNHFFTSSVALEVGLGAVVNDATKTGVKSIVNYGLNAGLQIFLPTKQMKELIKNK